MNKLSYPILVLIATLYAGISPLPLQAAQAENEESSVKKIAKTALAVGAAYIGDKISSVEKEVASDQSSDSEQENQAILQPIANHLATSEREDGEDSGYESPSSVLNAQESQFSNAQNVNQDSSIERVMRRMNVDRETALRMTMRRNKQVQEGDQQAQLPQYVDESSNISSISFTSNPDYHQEPDSKVEEIMQIMGVDRDIALTILWENEQAERHIQNPRYASQTPGGYPNKELAYDDNREGIYTAPHNNVLGMHAASNLSNEQGVGTIVTVMMQEFRQLIASQSEQSEKRSKEQQEQNERRFKEQQEQNELFRRMFKEQQEREERRFKEQQEQNERRFKEQQEQNELFRRMFKEQQEQNERKSKEQWEQSERRFKEQQEREERRFKEVMGYINTRIEKMDQRHQEDSDTIQIQKDEIQKKNSIIQEKDGQLREQTSKIQDQGARIKEQDESIQDQRARIKEQDESIQDQRARIKEQDESIQDQGARIKEQDEKAKEQANSTRKLTEQLEDRLALLFNHIKNLKSEIAHLSRDKANNQNQIEGLERQKRELENKVARLRNRGIWSRLWDYDT